MAFIRSTHRDCRATFLFRHPQTFEFNRFPLVLFFQEIQLAGRIVSSMERVKSDTDEFVHLCTDEFRRFVKGRRGRGISIFPDGTKLLSQVHFLLLHIVTLAIFTHFVMLGRGFFIRQ